MEKKTRLYSVYKVDWQGSELFHDIIITDKLSDVVDVVVNLETDDNPLLARVIPLKDVYNASPIEYMNLFGKYDYLVEQINKRTSSGSKEETWEVKFPKRHCTYTIRQIVFSDYDIMIVPKDANAKRI